MGYAFAPGILFVNGIAVRLQVPPEAAQYGSDGYPEPDPRAREAPAGPAPPNGAFAGTI